MKVWFCCLILLLSLAPLNAQEAPNLLRNSGFEEGLSAWFLKGADRVKTEFSVTSHEKFQRALRLDVTPQAKDMPWSVVLRQEIGAPLPKGKQLTLKAWLRSPEKMQVTAFVEGAKAPYVKTLTATITLTPEWQE
ncbi:MAG TPA: carbohydrate binding domain-containing protein, partial [Abditibacteriaceae bacterium]